MHENLRQRGLQGEQEAAAFLKKAGYSIVQRNVRVPCGEIDVVARDGDVLCFIEVKTRLTESQGHPFEAVTKDKQARIVRAALQYLQMHGDLKSMVRFDVVAVIPGEEGFVLELLKNAFEA